MIKEIKDRGIKWIGDIPADWELNKIKYIASSVFQGNGITKEDVVEEGDTFCVRYGEIYTKYNFSFIDCVTKTNEKLISPKRYFSHGDILFVGTGEAVEEIGKNVAYLGYEKCLAGGDIIVVRHNQDPAFLSYAMNSSYAQAQKSYGKAKLKVVHISPADIGNLIVLLPPLAEQQTIAAFLDDKCAKLDSIIADLERQIEILQEYKKSVITHAVTKGLNSSVSMKDSGIEWIGEMPANWTLLKMKYYSYMKGRIGWQGLTADEFTDEGPYLVTGTDFENGHVCWDRSYHISEKRYNEAIPIQLQVGDLLVTKDGTIGKLAYIDELPDKASLNSHLLVIRPIGGKYINRFLYWVLSSSIFRGYYELVSSGSTMDSLSQEKIGEFSFFAPSIKEQNMIADYLEANCGQYDDLIDKKKEQLNKVYSYKSSLIYEYVTGKKRVKEAAINAD